MYNGFELHIHGAHVAFAAEEDVIGWADEQYIIWLQEHRWGEVKNKNESSRSIHALNNPGDIMASPLHSYRASRLVTAMLYRQGMVPSVLFSRCSRSTGLFQQCVRLELGYSYIRNLLIFLYVSIFNRNHLYGVLARFVHSMPYTWYIYTCDCKSGIVWLWDGRIRQMAMVEELICF